MLYSKKPCRSFFSSVVKNVASPNIEVKKLVYIYLLHYSESEPDLTLLSINTIQKSLSDQNAQVRAMALRVMSGIKVPVISQIVSLAIKKGIVDLSPHVRKAAALAIPKCYRLAPSTLPQLIDYLAVLLGDKQYFVVGSALSAFLEICPDRIDLIHKHYRSLIRKLVDMDEWGQLAMLRLMTIYARKCFPQRMKRVKKAGAKEPKGFYDDEQQTADEDAAETEQVQELDADLILFLNACKPLLYSRNSAVIVGAAQCFLQLGTPGYLDLAIGPLMALLRSPEDIRYIVLQNIVAIALHHPEPFVPFVGQFLVHTTDPLHISRLKIEMLTLIFPHCDTSSNGLILSELEHFTKSLDITLARESVRAIGRCAQSEKQASMQCLDLLLKQVSSKDEKMVEESFTVVRHIIQQDPPRHTRTVIRLAKMLDLLISPEARASVIWLVGEFAGLDEQDNIAPDVLRLLAKGFADEAEPAKLQIVLLAAKVYLHHLNRVERQKKQEEALIPDAPVANESQEPASQAPPPLEQETENSEQTPFQPEPQDQIPAPEPEIEIEHPIILLWQYVLLLARYDTSYDLRDRMRFIKGLLADPTSTQLATLILLAPKPAPFSPSPSAGKEKLLLGSSSLILGSEAGPNGLPGYEDLPEWVKEGEEPDPKLREEIGGGVQGGKEGGGLVPAGDVLDRALREKDKTAQEGSAGKVDKGKGREMKSLDEWFAEPDARDEEDEKEESSEEETDEETDEEEYESEEETTEEETDSDSSDSD